MLTVRAHHRIVIDDPKGDFADANSSQGQVGWTADWILCRVVCDARHGSCPFLCRSARRNGYSDERLWEIVASRPDTAVPLYR